MKMVFKLVRTDSAEPCKIELPTGKHLIGRGRFLDCEDKRVSRNHGNIEFSDNTVTIKALHQNPFFIKKKDSKETQILSQDNSVIINNGDRFGLLPESYWYELMYCASAEPEAHKVNFDMECNQDTSSTESESVLAMQNTDSDTNKTIVNDSSGSPSLINQDESSSVISSNHACNRLQGTDSPDSNNLNHQVKRQHSVTDEEPKDDVKKIKTEVKVEPHTQDQPGDVAGPSNDQQAQQNADNNPKVPAQVVPQPQNPRPRERCDYGIDCYRITTMDASQSSRVSVSQLEKLLDFLESHEDLALGHCRSNEGRQRNRRLWSQVASILNSVGDGVNKDGTGWSKYWTIFKNRLKNKIRTDRASRRQTGAGPSNVVFTPLEERAMAIIGSDAGAPLRGVQVDPLPVLIPGAVLEESPLVVQENQENIDMLPDCGQHEFVDERVDFSTAPVTPAPATASITTQARPIRRQRTRPRLHSLSETRSDILRIEEMRVAAEARNAESLQQIAPALLAIAAAISELAAVLRRDN